VKIRIGGKEFVNFTEGSVTSQLNAMSRSFILSAVTRGIDDVPFRKGQRVEISIENSDEDFVRVFTGHIEAMQIAGSQGDVTYSLRGRDLIGDVVDSNMDGLSDLGSTVKYTCESVLRFLKIDSKVIDLAGTSARPFPAGLEIVAPDPGDTGAEFLASVALRRQSMLTSDGFGNLVITEGIGNRTEGLISNHASGYEDHVSHNNILRFDYSTDDSSRFHYYVTDCQLNVAAVGSIWGAQETSCPVPTEIGATTAFYKDPAIRIVRRRAVSMESTYPPSEAIKRARWEANISRAEGTTYSVTVPGHLDQEGNPWDSNTAPLVHDEFAGIEGRMLVNSVRWSFGRDGDTTDIGMTEVGAYQARLVATNSELLSEGDSDSEGEFIE
jgi:prophage tail gpP-like protein